MPADSIGADSEPWSPFQRVQHYQDSLEGPKQLFGMAELFFFFSMVTQVNTFAQNVGNLKLVHLMQMQST